MDERTVGSRIRLTDQLRTLLADGHAANLGEDAEARWRLVETAWELNHPRQLLTVQFEPTSDTLVVPRGRSNITGTRGALNGYQNGHCFYCFAVIEIGAGSALSTCHVDHVFPWSIGTTVADAPINDVWNLRSHARAAMAGRRSQTARPH